MEREQQLQYFIEQSVKGQDPNSITEATQQIENLEQQPDIAIVYSNLLNSNQTSLQQAIAVNYNRYIRNNWFNIPQEVQEAAKNMLVELVQNCASWDTLKHLAEVVATIFKASILWTPAIHMVIYFHQNKLPDRATLILSKIIPLTEPGTVHELWRGFRAIAMTGLNCEQLSIKFMAFDVFFEIYDIEESFDILEPIIEVVNYLITQYQTFNGNDFDKFWSYIYKLLKIKQISNELATFYLENAVAQLEDETIELMHKSNIISSIIPIIPQMSPEIMHLFVTKSIELAIGYVEANSDLPTEILSFIDSLLQIRGDVSGAFVYEGFTETFGSGEMEQIIVAVCLLCSIIQFDGSLIENSLETVQQVLTQSIQSEEEILIRAALRCLAAFDECTANVAMLAREFIPSVIEFLVSESSEIRVDAYNALMSMCPLCESSVPGLLEAVWGMHTEGQVADDNTESYIVLLATIIEMEKLNDSMVSTILQFAIEMITGEGEPTMKAVTLTMIGTLIEYDDTIPQQIPNLAETISALFQYENQEVIIQVLTFLRCIAFALRANGLMYITPFMENIGRIVDGSDSPRLFSVALETAAVIIRRMKDLSLLEQVCNAMNSLLKSDSVEMMKDGCAQIPQIAAAIAEPTEENKERSAFFLTHASKVVVEEIDTDAVEVALEAITHLVKHCLSHNPEMMLQQCAELMKQIIDGDTALGAGDSPIQSVLQPELAQYIIEFFFEVLTAQDSVDSEMLQFCLNWMQQSAVAVDPVIGQLSDLIVKRPIPQELVGNVILFTKGLLESANARIQQHVVTFLSRATRAFLELQQIIAEFIPTCEVWFNDERGKDGYGDVVANIASLFLAVPTTSEQFVVESLALFPPSDVKETGFMAESVFARIQNGCSPAVAQAAAFAIAKLVTEPQSMSAKRKIAEEVNMGLRGFLVSFMKQAEESAQFILQNFADSQRKIEIIQHMLE